MGSPSASHISTTPTTTGSTSTNSGPNCSTTGTSMESRTTVSEQTNDLLRAAWRRFNTLHDDLLESALTAGDLDEGTSAALLGHLVGHIQYMGLQLRSNPARPTL